MRTIVIVVLMLSGCAPYTRVQMQLTEQARKGVASWSLAQDQHVEMVEQMRTLQRNRVDEAFDADVRESEDLTPDWIIEHRRAYAAALDALNAARLRSREADGAIRANIRAADEALEQLMWLQSIELNLFLPREGSR